MGVVNNKIKKPVRDKKALKTFRRELRNNLTFAEVRLWAYLKNRQVEGKKFRRQSSIDNYILDFYCPEEKIAVELDGEVHNDIRRSEYDNERNLFLEYYGIRVLRFENKEVFDNPDGVVCF